MFGVPQEGKNSVSRDLRTDHDVMFIMKDFIASESLETSLKMEQVEDSLEFYHLVPRHRHSTFMKHLKKLDTESSCYKLSNQRAKEFLMNNILSNITQAQFMIASGDIKIFLFSVFTFIYSKIPLLD